MMNGSSGQAISSRVIIGWETTVWAVTIGSGTAVLSSGSSHGAATPPTMHSSAITTVLTAISSGAQQAFSASWVRGAPRKVTP